MSPTPKDVVSRLLQNTSNEEVMNELIAPDAEYVSLCFDNPPLHKIMAHAGRHPERGPQAIISTFKNVDKIWANEDFKVEALFGEGSDVAVFGQFTYRSRSLGKVYTSPFSIHCKVEAGQVTYMLFQEDTVSLQSVRDRSRKLIFIVSSVRAVFSKSLARRRTRSSLGWNLSCRNKIELESNGSIQFLNLLLQRNFRKRRPHRVLYFTLRYSICGPDEDLQQWFARSTDSCWIEQEQCLERSVDGP